MFENLYHDISVRGVLQSSDKFTVQLDQDVQFENSETIGRPERELKVASGLVDLLKLIVDGDAAFVHETTRRWQRGAGLGREDGHLVIGRVADGHGEDLGHGERELVLVKDGHLANAEERLGKVLQLADDHQVDLVQRGTLVDLTIPDRGKLLRQILQTGLPDSHLKVNFNS